MLVRAYLAIAARVGARMMLRRGRMANYLDPGHLGLPFEDLRLTAADGVVLAAWYVPALRPSGKAIVHVNGHGGNRSWWVETSLMAWLHDEYDQLAPDLRACGDSEGDLITFGWREHLDVLAAIAELERRGNGAIALQGNSMGAATAILTATRKPEVIAVWADAPYATVFGACVSAALMHTTPFPRRVVRAILDRVRAELGTDFSDIEPLAVLPDYGDRPLALVHGMADPYVDPENSRILHLAARTPDKSLWLVPDAGHGDSILFAPEEYRERILAFLTKALRRDPEST